MVSQTKELDLQEYGITSEKMAWFCKHIYTFNSESYGNGTESARRAGYKGTDNYLARVASELVRKCKVKAAKSAIQAENREVFDWNRDQNLLYQRKQIDRYNAILEKSPDNLQALQGLNQVLRELNASNGQHSQTINTNNKTLAINVQSK